MADDQNLSQQDIQDLQEIVSKLPNGDARQKKINLLLNSQPTKFEQGHKESDVLGTALSTIGSALKPRLPSSFAEAGNTMLNTMTGDPLGGRAAGAEGARRAVHAFMGNPQDYTSTGKKLGYAAASGLSSAIPGLNPESMEARAESGDTSGILGEAAGAGTLAASPLITEGVVRAAGATRRGIGRIAFDENRALKPAANVISRIGGATVGGAYGLATGHPYLGLSMATTGATAGPSMMEAMFKPKLAPESPVYPGAVLPATDEFYLNRGNEINAVNKLSSQFDKLQAKKASSAFESPVTRNPGASLPAADEFYQNRGEELMARQKAQDLIDKRAASGDIAEPEPPNPEGPAAPRGQVLKLPVPRELLPGENPGYMASTKRNRLLNLGRQGRPGAGDQLRNIGNNVLYLPEEYPGPRQSSALAPQADVPQGNATPFEPQPAYAGPERRGSLRDITGPSFERNLVIKNLRDRISQLPEGHPDRAVMESQLADIIQNPFERHEGGDINSMKAKTTVSRAEAEANTKKRLEGRNKRFNLPMETN